MTNRTGRPARRARSRGRVAKTGRRVKTNRFPLRVLQNRTGLVPRPSWCTYQVRPLPLDGSMMPIDGVRRVFQELGELDMVRLSGPEPLLRSDLDEVAETILEASRPAALQLLSDGQVPEAAEAFARGLSGARRLRVLVRFSAIPGRDDPFIDHRRFALSLETLKRLRPIADERGFWMAAFHEVSPQSTLEDIARLRAGLEGLGVELYVTYPNQAPPGQFRPIPQWVDIAEAALENLETRPRGLARTAERYLLQGTRSRLLGQADPKPRPKCTALRSHVRIEPDGDIPVCGHRPERVGNLAQGSFDDVWFSSGADRGRGVVDACVGCWSAEEVVPNALYTGEFVGRFRDRGIAAAVVRRSQRRSG